jgi:hypothetical protein
MGSRAAPQSVANPVDLPKCPFYVGVLGVWGSRLVVHLAKNGISGQPLRTEKMERKAKEAKQWG